MRQLALFDDPTPVFTAQADARTKLMGLIDRVNRGTGRGTLRLASAGITSSWTMKREKMTPAYTTRWEELPAARA